MKNISSDIKYKVHILDYNDLSLSYDELIDLDITFAKAKYSKKYNGTMPSINKDGVLELYNCYHPLLNVTNIIKNNNIF